MRVLISEWSIRRGRLVALVMAGLSAAGTTAPADDLDPTGGLRSRAPRMTEPDLPGASREELVRRWDLDGNGTVGGGDLAQLLAAWGPC